MADPKDVANTLTTRRTLILGAALIPAASIRAAPQNQASPAVAGTAAPVPALSPDERRILSAFVDRLVPKDELGPGATECGVVEYIDGCLSGFLAAEKRSFVEGLAALESFSHSSQGAPFSELTAAKQDSLLSAIDHNEVPALRPFFDRARRLTLEGMFGDPSYGGNVNFAGWDLIRYPGAKLAASAQDQRMSTPAVPYRRPLYGKDGGSHGH